VGEAADTSQGMVLLLSKKDVEIRASYDAPSFSPPGERFQVSSL
jgi:hypothetical protein